MQFLRTQANGLVGEYQAQGSNEVEAIESILRMTAQINHEKRPRDAFVSHLKTLFPEYEVVRNHDVYEKPKKTTPFSLKMFLLLGEIM